MVKLRFDQEVTELDVRIDIVNVVFGAALGGYIGVVMTRGTMDIHRSIVLSIALFVIVSMLVAMRSLLHVLRGTRLGSWKPSLAVCVAGLFLFFLMRSNSYLDMGVLVPISIAWLLAIVAVVVAHVVAYNRLEKHED